MENARRVERDPHGDDDRLADKKGGRPKKPREGLRLEREPVAAEDWREMTVLLVEAKMVGLGSRRRDRLGGVHSPSFSKPNKNHYFLA